MITTDKSQIEICIHNEKPRINIDLASEISPFVGTMKDAVLMQMELEFWYSLMKQIEKNVAE